MKKTQGKMSADETISGRGLAGFLEIAVDHKSENPLFHQIYVALRDAILAGKLPAGSKLLSSRTLTDILKVSRTSVISAYEQLRSEGYITGRPGSGTYVAESLQDVVEGVAVPASLDIYQNPAQLSRAGLRAREIWPDLPVMGRRPFTTGVSSADARSLDQLYKSGRKHLQDLSSHGSYDDPQGRLELRVQIANYLNAARGVRCSPEQIVVVSGSQQAMDLAIRVLVDPGQRVWLEDPCYKPASAAVYLGGAEICPIPVDEYGINVRHGVKHYPDARLAYVTPSHQYPMGVSLPAERRLELLRWANEAGAWVVEDDYDCEFRYDGHPLATLYSLDGGNRVIYMGSFSKVLLPGLRLGYVVVPPALRDAFVGARYLMDRHPPMFQQALVREFLASGYLAGHIRRMRAVYRQARDTLVDRLHQHLADHLGVTPPAQGMHLVARLKNTSISDVQVARRASEAGVIVRPISPLFLAQPRVQGLMLGFTGYSTSELMLGCSRLVSVFQKT